MIALSLIVLPAIAVYVIGGPVIAPWTISRIKQGMTVGEVERVLGPPARRDESQWTYERWGTSGWVEVHFNNDQQVAYVNDESAIPIH